MSNNSKQSKQILPGSEPSHGFPSIKQLEAEAKGTPKGKFKVAGHVIDNRLKSDYPKDNTSQLSIFDQLQEETQLEIKEAQVEKEIIKIGLTLSPSENKIVDSLSNLLHENSQNQDPEKPNYFTGNSTDIKTITYLDEETPIPQLLVTLYQLTQVYRGSDSVSGKDVENVKGILHELDKKRFLLKYTETTKTKSGEEIKDEYEGYESIIKLGKATRTKTKNNIEYYKKTVEVISLHPIFRRQIEDKYILYPSDINKRTEIAYGNAKVSGIAIKLRDYLVREKSSGRYSPEIGLDRLYYTVAEKEMKASKKDRARKGLDKALDTVKNLGLLLSHEVKPGATGEPKIIFKLNKNWD